MRTTLTLDADVVALLDKAVRERDLTFKAAVNDAIRRGLSSAPIVDVVFPTRELGGIVVDLDHATRLAGDLEDDALVRKLAEGR